jgi:hypothetical protein
MDLALTVDSHQVVIQLAKEQSLAVVGGYRRVRQIDRIGQRDPEGVSLARRLRRQTARVARLEG